MSGQWTNMEGDLYLGKGNGVGGSDLFFRGQLTCESLFDEYVANEALIDYMAITNKCVGENKTVPLEGLPIKES